MKRNFGKAMTINAKRKEGNVLEGRHGESPRGEGRMMHTPDTRRRHLRFSKRIPKSSRERVGI